MSSGQSRSGGGGGGGGDRRGGGAYICMFLEATRWTINSFWVNLSSNKLPARIFTTFFFHRWT